MEISSKARALGLMAGAAVAHQLLWVLLLVAVIVVVVCATIVIIVVKSAESDRPKVVAALAPAIERLASLVTLGDRGGSQSGRRKGEVEQRGREEG